MPDLTLRNLDSTLLRRLESRAADHGRSLDEEAKAIICDAVATAEGNGSGDRDPWSAADAIHRRLSRTGGSVSDSAELQREDRSR